MSDKKPNPVGRPSSYKPEYCQQMLEFFDRYYTQKKNGKTEAVDFPSVAGFARKIKVAKSTLYEWAKHHPEFSNVLSQCKDIQEDILLSNSLKGSYHAAFAQFLLKNTHNFKDRTEQETTIKEKRTINIVNDSDES